MRPPTPDTPTPFLVVVTDAQGATIDNAQLVSQAWMIAVSMQVNGFAPLQQTLAVQVLSAFAPETVRAPIGSGDAACAAAHGMRNESAARKR
jgi:hypothetical protein